MSAYTLGEIVIWLVLTAGLGFALGWLAHELRSRSNRAAAGVEPVPPEPVQPVRPGRFVGSAEPLDGGAAPSPDYVVKGNTRSMIYHAPDSPAYQRTTAHTWFRTAADAEAAGFRRPRNA